MNIPDFLGHKMLKSSHAWLMWTFHYSEHN